jgi:ATP-dependent RNA circularization protein (DNA/RNA ligase family)
MFQKELKNYVETHPKLVSMRPAGDGIFVLKYKKTVFFDNLWNRFLEECRGTIVDADYNVVSRPFTKIYNFRVESAAPKLADSVKIRAWRKINGFMVAVTLYKGKLLVSTTGSTDSDFVKMARELIDEDRYLKVCLANPGKTFMFECVHRNDPHIIPETEGMYLLGYRDNTWGDRIDLDYETMVRLTNEFGTHPVGSCETTVGQLVEDVKKVRHEGFVFYTEDGVSAKIKSPFYLVNKFVARNPRTDKLMRPDVKKSLDEEYYPLIDAIQADIEAFTALDEQARLEWVRNFFGAN